MTATVLLRSSITENNMFEYRLESFGFPLISRWSVFFHQLKLMASTNPGPWLFVHLWFWGLDLVINQFFGLENLDDEDDESFDGLIKFLLIVGAIILMAVAGPVLYAYTGWSWYLALILPAAVCSVSILLTLILPAQGFTRAQQFWRYAPATNYFNREASVPAHIRKRFESLQEHQHRDVEIFVLEFANDPFLVAVEKSNRPWFLRRKAVVGAWGTDTPMDQI